MNTTLLIPILRQLLHATGGALVTAGYLDADGLDAATGLVINAVTLAWWFYDRQKVKKAIEASRA